MSASPAMALDRTNENGGTVRFRRDTLLWLATVLLQLLLFVYSYGRLSERVDAQGKQLDRIEEKFSKFEADVTGRK